jgi:hypothetical protein
MNALIFTCALAMSSTAWAQDWSTLDARTRSLGGAGVAFADGRGESMYWNPASLAVGAEKPFDFSTGFAFSISAFVEVHATDNVTADVQHIVDQYEFFNFQQIQQDFDNGTVNAADLQNALKIVDDLHRLNEPGKGVLIGAASSFNLRIGPIGLFVNVLGNVGVSPVVDFAGVGFSTDANFFSNVPPASGTPTAAQSSLSAQLQARAGLSATDADNLAFHAQQSLGDAAISDPAFVDTMVALAQGTGASTSLYDNPSGVFVRGLAQAEIGISFALPLFPTLLDVGVSFKEIISETSFRFVSYAEQDSGDDFEETIREDLRDNRVRSTDFNVDLGAKLTPTDWLTVAIAGRNLIPMDIKYKGPGKMHMDPQVRLGAMVSALGFLKLGADIDLLENESPVLPGYKTRQAGVGLEFDLPVFKLRVGYAKNLAFSSDHGRLAAGFGFDLLGFVIDIGAQASLHKIVYQPASEDGTESKESFFSDHVNAGLTIGLNLPF